MAIPQLTDEQVRTWSLRQKDQWWLANVFRGDMAQLTIRSAITGFLLGGVLSATNLYIGAKTGWTLGVGLTSVILAFAVFRVMSTIGLAKDFTILENNAMQSIATAAGYMTGPLISGLAAYMMVKNQVIPWGQLLAFNVVLSILGVLVAFPMKRRFINDEQQPFPEGRACGVLLDTLYTSAASIGIFKAKALACAAIFAGTIKFMTGESYQQLIQLKWLGMSSARWVAEHPLEKIASWLHINVPQIGGIDIRKLDLNPSINLEMFGAGGLMNIRYGTNMLIGMLVMWVVVAPPVIRAGDATNSKGQAFTVPAVVAVGQPIVFRGETFAYPVTIAAKNWIDGSGKTTNAGAGGPIELVATNQGVTRAGEAVVMPVSIENGTMTDAAGKRADVLSTFNRAQVLNTWGLWPGVAMLVCASMVSLFAKPQIFIKAFSGFFRKSAKDVDPIKHIELPMWVPAVFIPIVGAVGVWMAHEWFGVSWMWGALAIPLIGVLTLIAAQSTALTSITPTGSLSKITQFTFGYLDKKFPQTLSAAGLPVATPAVNLMTATMTTEVASNAANLLMDIKPGYMLGAKPRQQVIGHMIGIVSGALASTPLFYVLFLAGHQDNPFTKANPELAGKTVEDVLLAAPDKFSFIGAVQWKAISDLITSGLGSLPQSAIYAMAMAAVFGVVFEIWRLVTKNKSPISPLAIGLGIVLPPDSTLWMFMGAAFFWLMGRIYRTRQASMGHKLWIDTHEPICAGLVAGAALIGIGDMLVKVFVL